MFPDTQMMARQLFANVKRLKLLKMLGKVFLMSLNVNQFISDFSRDIQLTNPINTLKYESHMWNTQMMSQFN